MASEARRLSIGLESWKWARCRHRVLGDFGLGDMGRVLKPILMQVFWIKLLKP
jgi:hypothetical protein